VGKEEAHDPENRQTAERIRGAARDPNEDQKESQEQYQRYQDSHEA
jgi:hypothetical protein